MAYHVNGSTFKKSQNSRKKNSLVPLVIIIILALLMVFLNYFIIDVTSSLYDTQQETQVIETETTISSVE